MTNQDSAIRKSFKFSEVSMNLNGLLPGEKYQLLYTIYSYVLLIIYIIMIPVLGYMNIIMAKPGSRVDLFQKSFVYLELFISVFKHWPFITKPDQTKRLLNRWNESIFNTDVDIDKHIIHESIRRFKLMRFLFFLMTVMSPLLLIQSIIFSSHDDLKLPIWVPVDIYNNTMLYTITNVYVVTGYIHGVFGYFSVDFLIAGYILYCATQIRLIKFKLENMDKYVEKEAIIDPQKTTTDGLPHKKIYDQIIQCIKVYDAVFGHAQELENVYSIGIFSQFFVGSMVLSICMYNLSKVNTLMNLAYVLSFLIPTALLLYLYCDQGTLIIEESTTIGAAIFKSPWYTYDKKTKMLLYTFMERTKKPIKFTVGKLVDLSLETFVVIINRSYSLLALLKNVY
ncbi:unnamed protein product [Phyllotreta striolata]|uniref:Odorant receptor n=1 Tax=Phyllotreta striolata TaxID=444603 RepID=A0A9N9TT58_PHYSR|nr:unnamed protein product [Phyllotreta striolata]